MGDGGLYDDLPLPADEVAPVQNKTNSCKHETLLDESLLLKPRPADAGDSLLFLLDDVIIHQIFEFLALPEVGTALPATCRLVRFLRVIWIAWQRFEKPLRRERVRVEHLLNVHLRSLEELSELSEAIQEVIRSSPGKHRLPSSSSDLKNYSYFELATPRVQWSLHNEGFSNWRSCSDKVDVSFALLPPWDRHPRRRFLPQKVRLVVGISLWLPPSGADAEHSWPALWLNCSLEQPEVFEALAERHPDNPPCLAATCEAIAFRPRFESSQKKAEGLRSAELSALPHAQVLEEWSCRFCFGPTGYRHVGHGETEGFDFEVSTVGRRRWRPPDLCFARVGEQPQDQGLHLLLQTRRCIGLLE
eukprot:TRINITY_DN3899_c0_g2_i2.p1 TRINITY_DN3899_c0_g2~~TRINITY_DN3899_c0_g2_i2.p1  ORF type:complete len:360 (-),score=59.87 TRINITY_DN3899_c0_g2_i2:206-1285(-)